MPTIAPATRQRVLDHWRQTGDPPGKIALELHLSLSTVGRVLREAGHSGEHKDSATAREMRAEQAPKVRQLAADGVSPTQICKRLRLGYDTLKLIAAEHDIELPHRRTGAPSEYDRKVGEIRELAAQGLNQSEISLRTSVPLPTLRRWLEKAGIAIGRDPGRTRSPDQALHFGSSAAERSETGRRGGLAAIGDKIITRLYCGTEYSRGRTGSGRVSRNRFCSTEHAHAYHRENSGKTVTVTCGCGCGEQFLTWSARPKKYLSREHWIKARRGIPEYGYDGHIIQGGYEAAFIGLCSLRGIRFEFFDRSQAVRWDGDADDAFYGPDFVLPYKDPLFVDTKGWQQKPWK
jgi:hypothetical protein